MAPSDLTADFIALLYSASLRGQVDGGDIRPIRYTDHIRGTASHSSRAGSRRNGAAMTVERRIPDDPAVGYHGPTTVIQDTSTFTTRFHRTTRRENDGNDSTDGSEGGDEDNGGGTSRPSSSSSAPGSPPSIATTSLPPSSPEPESESSTSTGNTFPSRPIPIPLARRMAVLTRAKDRARDRDLVNQRRAAAQRAAGRIAREQARAFADEQERAWVEEELLVAAEDAGGLRPVARGRAPATHRASRGSTSSTAPAPRQWARGGPASLRRPAPAPHVPSSASAASSSTSGTRSHIVAPSATAAGPPASPSHVDGTLTPATSPPASATPCTSIFMSPPPSTVNERYRLERASEFTSAIASDAPVIEGPSRLVFIVTDSHGECMIEEVFEPPLLVEAPPAEPADDASPVSLGKRSSGYDDSDASPSKRRRRNSL